MASSSNSTALENQHWESYLFSDGNLIPLPQSFSSCKDVEVVRGIGGRGNYHVYHRHDGSRIHFTCLKELLLYVSQGDLFFLHQQMHRHYSNRSTDLVGRSLYYDLSQLCLQFDDEQMSTFWQDQDSWVVHSWKLFERSSVHMVKLVTGRRIYMFVG